MTEDHTYRVVQAGKIFVGTCTEFPDLSFVGPDEASTLAGIKVLVDEKARQIKNQNFQNPWEEPVGRRAEAMSGSDQENRARISEALRGIEAAEALASGELLVDTSNADLLDIEERLVRILRHVRAEIDNRGLN